MNCSELDWKGFVLNEVAPGGRRAMEEHLQSCAACRQEVDALGLTLVAVRQLRQHPIPRRIAFVSDPVFDAPWWKRLWRSGPQLGFAAAAMLSLAILVHAFVARAPRPAPAVAAQVDPAAIERAVQAELARRAPEAVEASMRSRVQPAIIAVSARLAESEKRAREERRADLRDVSAAFEVLQKRVNNVYLTAARYGGD